MKDIIWQQMFKTLLPSKNSTKPFSCHFCLRKNYTVYTHIICEHFTTLNSMAYPSETHVFLFFLCGRDQESELSTLR